MSFRLKTVLGIAIIEAALLLLLLLVWHSLSLLQTSNEEALEDRARSSASLFALTIKDAVTASDLATVEASMRSFSDAPGLVYLRVTDNRGVTLAEYGAVKTLPEVDRAIVDANDGVFDTLQTIAEGGIAFGQVQIGFSVDSVQALVSAAR